MLITLEEFLRKKELWERLKNAVVIYPTDTVYGIGCNAEREDLVERIYKIKKRPRNKPVSVIAPSFEWIFEHCICEKEVVKRYLPGAYTLILPKKSKDFLSWVASGETIGVRIPAHPIAKVVEALEIPFVTTSANISGEKPASSLQEIPCEILEKASIIIDGGELPGKPSTIIDLTKEKPLIIERER